MARPLRIEYPGAVYHVTSRGNERKPIFQTDKDRELFLGTLHHVTEKFNWTCHAYCLMDNHYHLLTETPEGNLSRGMRQLNGVYTQAFNKRHNRVGHIFQGRYKAILIQKDSHLLEVCRYVVLNPIRAGAVEKPEDYHWSSYNATRGNKAPHPCMKTEWILEQFGSKKKFSMQKYEEFVKEGIDHETIWNDLKGQIILGEEDFVEKMEVFLKDKRDNVETPRSQRHIDRPSLDTIFMKINGSKKARNRGIIDAVYKYAYSQREVAGYLGLHYSTVSVALKRVYIQQ